MADEGRKPTALGLLAKVGELMSLPAAYLFFTGFLYAYYYFSGLGVQTRLVDTPLAFYPVFAFSVLMENWGLVVVWGGAVGLLALLATRGLSWATGALLLLILLAFPGCWWMARNRGYYQAALLRNGLDGRHITFDFKREEKEKPTNLGDTARGASNVHSGVSEELLKANAEGQLVLAVETKEVYYVLWQIYPDRGLPELPRARLFMVPREDVSIAAVTLDSVVDMRQRSKDGS